MKTRALPIDTAALSATVLASAVYAGRLLKIGWVPSDEGTLATSALRVLQGQLPQRDFSEIYTGGLSFFHAFAFRWFGVNLFSLRIAVFMLFLCWVPVVYFIARKFLSPWWAAVAALTAVSWSYPNYVAAMPSWYNLFLATFGVAALLRFIEVRRRRWLVVAGVCGGLSVLVKVIGLYDVATVLLWLLFMEQSEAEAGDEAGGVYKAVCGSCLLLYLTALVVMIFPQLRDGEAYHFLLPSFCLVGLLFWRERQRSSRRSAQRFVTLLRLGVPFLLGVAAPVIVYLLLYVRSGSVGMFFHAVFFSAGSRLSGLAGRTHAPGVAFLAYPLATMALLGVAVFAGWARSWKATAIVGAGLLAVLACSAIPAQLQDTWLMAGGVTPLIVAAAVVVMGRAQRVCDGVGEQRLMLLVCAAAVCSLVQYPLPYVTYFCYTAPLTLLAAVALVSWRHSPSNNRMLAVVLVFFLGLGAMGVVAKHVFNPDLHVGATHALELPRAGGLRVDATTPHYEELIALLQAHAANGVMYAGNDCPQLYFLSGLKNPTRDDTGAPDAEVLAALRSGELGLVVFNDEPFFASGRVSAELRAAVVAELPQTAKVGVFSVYWR